ncbi:hypothetical protein BpsS140_00028 [Bacillus phage vB_BpsS-140]|nr:hypothetical protein BpsS140_00028 [Bacillus phage vB_BpsS-140]
MAIKIDVKKTHEDIDIGGTIYRIDVSDDTRRRFMKERRAIDAKAEELQAIDVDKLDGDEAIKYEDDVLENMRKITTILIGEDAFDPIYEVCGRSTFVFVDVIEQVTAVMDKYIKETKIMERAELLQKQPSSAMKLAT